MFDRPTDVQMLTDILSYYEEDAGSNPDRLRALIPPHEIWRLFVEARIQKSGRRLKSENVFKNPKVYKTTIKEFMESTEGVNFSDQTDWDKSILWQVLKKKYWELTPKQCSELTLNDLLLLDKAWIPFEMNESNYFKAMYTAFNEIFNPSHHLSTHFIKTLQHLSVNNVKGTNFDIYPGDIGRFRTCRETAFLLTKNCASPSGIYEFLAKNRPQLSIYLRVFEKSECIGMINLNRDSLKLIREYVRKQDLIAQKKPVYEGKFDFAPYCLTNDLAKFINIIKTRPDMMSLIAHIGHTATDLEASKVMYETVKKTNPDNDLFFVSDQFDAENEDYAAELDLKINSYIANYNTAITNSKTPMHKLDAIIDFVQDCELLHPFYDANGRTFCMLLLNYLLITQGFPLAVLIDSNKFNLFSKQEMREELLDSMENTFVLMEEKKLFGVDTEELLKALKANPKFEEFSRYFEEIVGIEVGNRGERKALHELKS